MKTAERVINKVMCAIRDRKLDAFHDPVFFPTRGVALRWFEDLAESNEQLKAHREDYSLWVLGTFDQVSGLFQLEMMPELLGSESSRGPNGTGDVLTEVK